MCIYIYIYIFKFYLFILFLAALGLSCYTGFSLVAVSRGYSLVAALRLLIVVASHCGGFSCCEAWALGTQASVVVAPRF